MEKFVITEAGKDLLTYVPDIEKGLLEKLMRSIKEQQCQRI